MKTCPLGHTCDDCLWHVEIDGTDHSGKRVVEKNCAIVWPSILLVDLTSVNRGQQSVMENARNKFFELANGKKNIQSSKN